MADLAARVGSDEKRLSRTIVRINTIEATSPLATGEHMDEARCRRRSCRPSRMRRTPPTRSAETRDRVRAAIQSLPWRERKVIGLYYYGEVTMKQIGAEIGVNESRVSQLHARAIRRLRDALRRHEPAEGRRDAPSADRVHRQEAGDGEGGDQAADVDDGTMVAEAVATQAVVLRTSRRTSVRRRSGSAQDAASAPGASPPPS